MKFFFEKLIKPSFFPFAAHEHIGNLKDDLNDMKKAGEELKKDIEKLNNEIE